MQALDEKRKNELQGKNEWQGEDEEADAELQTMFRRIHGDRPKLLQKLQAVKVAGKVNETKDQDADESALTLDDIRKAKAMHGMDESTFDNVIGTFLAVAIFGYKDGVRSIIAKRNEILRQFNGDNVAAAWDNTWFIVPEEVIVVKIVLYLVPAVISVTHDAVKYMWYSLRDTCLMAALMGYDMDSDDTLQSIITAWVGVQASKVIGIGVAKVAHIGFQIWTGHQNDLDVEWGMRTLLGPQAGKKAYKILLPSCPWHYAAYFCPTDDIKSVPSSEYNQALDSEPTWGDRTWLLGKFALWTLQAIYDHTSPGLYAKVLHTIKAIRGHPSTR